MAYDVGRAVFGELEMVGGESSIIAVIVKLANWNKIFSGHGRENVGLASAQLKWS